RLLRPNGELRRARPAPRRERRDRPRKRALRAPPRRPPRRARPRRERRDAREGRRRATEARTHEARSGQRREEEKRVALYVPSITFMNWFAICSWPLGVGWMQVASIQRGVFGPR